jgi:hypothetical protein
MEWYILVNQFTERYRTRASECEIKGGADFKGRELGVEEEERMREGEKTGHL